jgi:hypothetical protein
MAEYFVDPEQGNDANNGTSTTTPWRLIPGQTGANAVTSGDTINVKNGTISTLQLIIPTNNLTYRGYGVASNVLMLTLPGKDARTLYKKRVVQTNNVNEGMWILDAGSNTTFGFLAFLSRSNVTIADCHIKGPLCTVAVSMGGSANTGINNTLSRCRISGASGTGIAAYNRGITLTDVLVENIKDDGIILGASVANGYKAGYTDTLLNVSIVNPGYDEISGIGDGIQTEAASDRFEAKVNIQNLYINKTSTTKQSLVLTDILGGLYLNTFHITGTPFSQNQILLSGVGSAFHISNGYFKEGCRNNSVFRYSGTQGIETGTSILIQNVIVDAALNGGFWSWGGSADAATVDGTLTIEHCYMAGSNQQNLSYSATVSTHPGSLITVGANAKLFLRNNIFLTMDQPSVRLPTGTANEARWEIKNNGFTSPTFAIGSTSYTTLASFQSNHSGAVNNIESANYLSSIYQTNPSSPAYRSGVPTNKTDLNKSFFYVPPSIGPYEYFAPRANAGIRGVR